MEAIGTLAGGIAHDFNNILSAVIGFSEVSLDLVEQGSQLHLNIKEVLNAGNRAKELVRQILSFSRQSEQEPSPIQVSHLAKEILKLLRASLPTTIEIRQCMNSEKLVLADATQIHQVLMNLCTNAGFAMKDSGGILTLTVADVDENETLPFEHSGDPTTSYQRISVSDTGRGIDTRYLDRIFDPFFTTKEKGEGTGMGLSVAHGIIQDHGGNITVENFPGQGVTFHVYLPVITEQMKNGPQKKDDLLPRGDEHILFVDDEPPLTKIGKQMLERLGYTVIDVTDSSEALSMVKSDPDRFDLIITDLTMPSMTGTMLAKEVLRIRPDLPIIISTGYSGELTDEAMKSSGIRALLMKPLLKKEMAITVRKVLDSRNAD
jgi:CheY-like chemotaxis protein